MAIALVAAFAVMAGCRAAALFDTAPPGWSATLAGGLVTGLIAFWLAGQGAGGLVWTALLLLPLACLATVDLARHEVPDLPSLALCLAGLARVWVEGGALPPILLVAGGLALTGLAVDHWAAERSPVGAGDFLLLAAAVTWFGPWGLLEVLLLAACLGLLMAPLVALRRGRAEVPFAPALALSQGGLWLSSLST